MKLECLICGGPSRGTHLGVRACNSCASFFRRTVLLHKKYTCKKTVKCNIDLVRYVKCPACRFQKCLELGMNWRALRGNNNSEADMPTVPHLNETVSQLFSLSGQLNNVFNDLKEAYTRINYRRTIFYKANSCSTLDERMRKAYLEIDSLNGGLFKNHETELKLYLSLINENTLLSMLPGIEKRQIFHHAACNLQALEILYSSWLCGKSQDSRCFAMPSGVYADVKRLDSYFQQSLLQTSNVNIEAIYKIHALTFANTMKKVDNCVAEVKPTEDDLIFLIGLIIFDPTTQDISKTTTETLQLARNQLLEGFMAGCDELNDEGMMRLDRVLSIIASIKVYTHRLRKNLIMLRQFDVIPYNQLFDQVWNLNFEI